MSSLNVTLSEEDWGKLLNLVADAPFKQVAPLIQQIQRQLQMQMEQVQREQVTKSNGAIEAHAPGA
jgi:hypothetical protein